VVLICISFMARDGEHFLGCFFFAIWISSFEKVLFISFAHFFTGLLTLRGVYLLKLPVFSGYQSFVRCIASKYFLPLCGWSLQFIDNCFCCVELFNFM
jgi:hypothetical protein